MYRREINFYFRKKKYGWLSNFERCTEEVGGVWYQTNEHFYQSQKSIDYDIRRWIISSPNPYLAMCAGRSLREGKELIEDWEEKKIGVMLKGLRAKFKDKKLRMELLATENANLHEDSPTDRFWGKKGKDMLGKLLMQIRDEIRNE